MSAEATNLYDINDTLNRALSRLAEYRQGREAARLLYAALDVRLCIERTLFEYLVLMKNEKLSKRMEKLYRATDLKNTILKEEPQFVEKIKFMNLWALPNEDKPFITPDLQLLSFCYGQVNDYLHETKRARSNVGNEARNQLYKQLDDASRHLVAVHSNLKGRMDLNDKGQDLFDKFVSGDLSIDEVRAILAQSRIRKVDRES